MSDRKMANNYAPYTPAELSQVEDSVVQALDVDALSGVDASSRLRAKLDEFAAELRAIRID